MTGFVWGDIEPADVYDPTGTVAPEQVARRLHRLIHEIEYLGGRRYKFSRRFNALPAVLQSEFQAVGVTVVDWLGSHQLRSPGSLAQAVHDTRRRFDLMTPAWMDLTGPERQIGIDLMDLILTWLRREGSVL